MQMELTFYVFLQQAFHFLLWTPKPDNEPFLYMVKEFVCLRGPESHTDDTDILLYFSSSFCLLLDWLMGRHHTNMDTGGVTLSF